MVLVAEIDLSTRVRQLRTSRHLTQQKLGELVGVSRQTIWNWEKGVAQVPSAELPTLARALGITVAELYGDPPPVTASGSLGVGAVVLSGSGTVRNPDEANVRGRIDELRSPDSKLLPVYRWGSTGDPRDHFSAPYPDRLEYAPLGKEQLIGPRGFGVEVKGDSMVGRAIRDGDVVWVNPDRQHRVADVVLALLSDDDGEGGMVVKTYARLDVGDCLVSETEEGKSTVVCDQFKIIGPVVLISPRPFPPR